MSKKLPKQAILKEKDNAWNFIPLGKALNDKNKVETIGWYINDQNIVKGIETYPCTSFLIVGETGAGKFRVERGILEHTAIFADRVQVVVADCKRVEFVQDAVQKCVRQS